MKTAEDLERLRQAVSALTWVHSIDLGNRIITPGIWGKPQPLIMRAFDDIDFRGRKVLDVGCWDGLWSFEAEKRGAAEVWATDDISQRSYSNQETFALGRLRKVTKPGGLILVEENAIYGSNDVSAEFFYRRPHGADESVWWVPTVPCLREWVESSYFEPLREFFVEKRTLGKRARLKLFLGRWLHVPRLQAYENRMALLARAVRRADPGYIFPDPEFKDFDLNQYPPFARIPDGLTSGGGNLTVFRGKDTREEHAR
jgi:tRNA (mo5U34)-methyltransferase